MRIPGLKKRIPVTFDLSLPVLIAILVYAIGFRYVPVFLYAGDVVYFGIGLLAAAGILASILFHEFGHAFAAARQGLHVRRIHLFALGGMAELQQRPLFSHQERLIALGGPAFSLLLAAFFGLPFWSSLHPLASVVASLLASTNLLLVVANILPVYPLDGGRVLRSLLWTEKRSFLEASALTYRVSSIMLALLCFVAFLVFLSGWSRYAYGLAAWLFYLGYMVISSKPDLLRIPAKDALLLSLTGRETTDETISRCGARFGYARAAIIPVFENEQCIGFHSTTGGVSELISIQHLIPGMFLDRNNLQTWTKEVEFHAEIVPVFEQGKLTGLADANELRFWLLQGYEARFRTLQQPD
jgi:Zn-dependent protease